MIKIQEKTLSWIIFLALTLIWGSAFLLIKIGNQAFSPIQGGAIRILSAGIVFIPISLFQFKKVQTFQEWFFIGISGLVGSYIPATLFAMAQTEVSSSTAGVLSSITPVFTTIISILFFKNRLSIHQYIGLIIGLIATGCLASFKDGSLRFESWHWLLIVAATLCYAINLNFLKFKLPNQRPLTISALSIAMVSPLAIFNIASSDLGMISNDSTFLYPLFCLIFLGITSTGIALILFNRLLKTSSPQFASSTTYAIPVVAIIWGVLDGEPFSYIKILCVIGILLGLFLLKRK